MDGTMFDTEKLWGDVINCSKYGITFDERCVKMMGKDGGSCDYERLLQDRFYRC